MNGRLIADLPPNLKSLQGKWIEARREERDIIYAREFGPAFIPLFARLPLHGWTNERPQFKALISILGFSWQPVALMAAWAQPEQMLILGTPDSLGMKVGGESAVDLVSRLSGIPRACILARQVEDPAELEIYQEVRDFVRRHGFRPHEIAVDPTGGKKSMSAPAALAGFLAGAWIIYIDYARYHPKRRIPIPGTEYPRLLHNPLEVFGDIEFDQVKQAYRRGSYDQAYHVAKTLATRLYQPREAEALALLAQAYGAWHRFDFKNACETLEKLRRHLEQFAHFGSWPWARKIRAKVQTQCSIVKQLAELAEAIHAGKKPTSIEQGLPLVMNHLSAAERCLSQHQPGVAILLAYASLERYVDLCLWVHYGLDDENPDFSNVKLELPSFHAVGRKLHGKNYQQRPPGGPLTLSLGIQLLATLKPDLLPVECLGRIKGMMAARNKSEFEHGLCAQFVKPDNVKLHIQSVKEIVGMCYEFGEDFEKELEKYNFPLI
ncbi:MAG: TIGR02710 family CRISPR-associated protein [Deltaproteobacteria bacterium]|nr:TIGR02710 family CRISPR-associated protein [Deltaproteobacteria bacterium]